MSYDLSQQHYAAMLKCSGAARYEYSIKKMADWEQVWSLRNEDGWVLSADGDGNAIVPIWPHPRFAEECATGDWHDTAPAMIEIHAWMDRWLPGIMRDGRKIAVFPLPGSISVDAPTVTAERLRNDLQSELDLME